MAIMNTLNITAIMNKINSEEKMGETVEIKSTKGSFRDEF